MEPRNSLLTVNAQILQSMITGAGLTLTYSLTLPVECWQNFSFTRQYVLPPPENSQMRVDWAPYDLTSPSGRRIEVKSAAYLQSWDQEYYSKIIFDIAPHRAWDAKTGYAPEAKRNSDLYVFCVYTALSRDKSILDLDLWDFYVLPTSILNQKIPTQKTIGLQSLQKLNPIKTGYSDLGKTIETIQL